jgi:hypothetical protein
VTLALLAASPAVFAAPPVRDAMTLGFFKRATAQGGEAADEAERYVEGTLHGMLLLSDALQRDGRPVFCADDAHARGDQLALDRLGAGFRAWLADGSASDSDLPEMQRAPIAMFVLSYLSTTLPCAQAAPAGEPGGENEFDPALERALPR